MERGNELTETCINIGGSFYFKLSRDRLDWLGVSQKEIDKAVEDKCGITIHMVVETKSDKPRLALEKPDK